MTVGVLADTSPMNRGVRMDQISISARAILAANVVKLRKEQGWSQEELAAQAGLHRTFIGHVERQIRNISLDNVEKIARTLGVPIHALLVPEEERKRKPR